MANLFTFVAEPGLVQIGSVIDLSASKSDPSEVVGSMEGKTVGYIANDPNLFFGKNFYSAKRIRDSVVTHPQCASAHGLILRCEPRKVDGKSVFLCAAEMYVVPKRKKAKSQKKDAISYLVGGIAAQNSRKVELMGKLQAMANNGEAINLPVQVIRISNKYVVVLPDQPVPGASAGTIKDPDEVLEKLIPDGETYPATIVELKNREYIVELRPEGQDISSFYPVIDAAVSRCAGQSKAIEAKVETMMNAKFDRSVIEAVVTQMPSLGMAQKGVPNPKTCYSQKNGCNLPDLTCYMLAGKMVRLVGEKGSGKNTLVESACWLLNRPMCRVQGSSELDKLDLLGSRTLKDGNTGFELSEFLCTLRDDGVAVIDEANTVRPEVLTILHSLTDGARAIDVPGYGTVRMGPHACILYTMNEDYVGTGEMNAATIDRGPTMIIEQEKDMRNLLRRSVPDASDQDIAACCKVSDEIRNAAKNGSGTISAEAITVRGYIDALECAKFIPLRRALIQNVANKAQSSAERAVIEGIITANIA